jgi:hypothetical protein
MILLKFNSSKDSNLEIKWVQASNKRHLHNGQKRLN